jgi:hypothetical protein
VILSNFQCMTDTITCLEKSWKKSRIGSKCWKWIEWRRTWYWIC